MIRVLIADDHDILRAGLRQILGETTDIEAAAEARNGHEVLAALRENQVDVVLLDMAMPGTNGIDLIREIHRQYPSVAVLVLSMYREEQYAVRALKAGAVGYLCKDDAATQLISAIRQVGRGGRYLNRATTESLAAVVATSDKAPRHTRLSDREFQVFRLLAAGRSVSEIAQELNLSVKTVSTHKTRILEKMGFVNLTDLIRYAIRHRFIDNGTNSGS